MRQNTTLGLLFSNRHDEALSQLTGVRAIGSVPFGGRYRLIDFALSNLVNAGVGKVGIVTKNNYQSLMDHIGSGKAWDLSRKTEGLYFLPPFGAGEEQYDGRITSLAGVMPFLRNSQEEFVILSDCHIVGNLDYRRLIDAHIRSGAEITVACCHGTLPKNIESPVITYDEQGRITDMLITDHATGEVAYGIGLYVIARRLLMQLVDTAVSRNHRRFEWDILQRHVGDRRLYAYRVPEYTTVISSLESYTRANFALLDAAVRAQLFVSSRPIYTKMHDCAPALYGLHADASGSLIADGCKIEGTVRDSIVFRNVHVSRGAEVRHCILMQGGMIGDNSRLEYVITDKYVCVRDGRNLKGCADYPVIIHKNAMV